MATEFKDIPKFWNEITDTEDTSTSEVIENLPVEQDETPPLPTIQEQKEIVNKSEVNIETKSILNTLIEINDTATILAKIQNDESKEQRNNVIEAIAASFIHRRMMNNERAEQLKFKLIERLSDNIESLDLETVARIYNDLTSVTTVDAQQALAKIGGGPIGNSGTTGPMFNINVAAGDNANATSNAMQVSTTTQPPIENLKVVSAVAETSKAWGNIPKPDKNIINIESTDNKK